MNNYEYDIAISLCHQDIDYAQKIVDEINPNLNVFFYKDRQRELISNLGPEVFSDVFKEKSRLVVLLYRPEWGDSPYTKIEKNAISDRAFRQGQEFIFLIPLIKGKTPNWFNESRIYADPYNYTIEELVRFIEFKVADLGGIVKEINLIDKFNNFQKKVERKQELVNLQQNQIALDAARNELLKVRKLFNEKIEFLRVNNLFPTTCCLFQKDSSDAYLNFENYKLRCKIYNPEYIINVKVFSAQDFQILFTLSWLNGNVWKDIQSSEELLFYYSDEIVGWSKLLIISTSYLHEKPLLFRNRDNQFSFDLERPITSEMLVEYWIKQLFDYGTQNVKSIL
jgi:hypothetical protein